GLTFSPLAVLCSCYQRTFAPAARNTAASAPSIAKMRFILFHPLYQPDPFLDGQTFSSEIRFVAAPRVGGPDRSGLADPDGGAGGGWEGGVEGAVSAPLLPRACRHDWLLDLPPTSISGTTVRLGPGQNRKNR